jgi:hypothetical protein
MRSKRGLSTIVVTLIIILLSLVAVGVVWLAVKGLIKGGTSGIDINTKCLGVNLEITKANCSAGTTNKICAVTLMRTGTESSALAGVKLVFKNETSGVTSSLINVDGDIPPLAGKTIYSIDTGIAKANGISKVETTAFFKDASENEQLCSQTVSLSFAG